VNANETNNGINSDWGCERKRNEHAHTYAQQYSEQTKGEEGASLKGRIGSVCSTVASMLLMVAM